MFEIEPPATREEIAEVLAGLETEITAYFATLADEEFLAPQGPHWSPAGHLRHLSKSVRAVARGMRQPKVLLLAFGFARGPARSFGEVVEVYRQALTDGAQAGRFAPSTETRARAEVESWWRSANNELREAQAGVSERALDRYRLPHPVLGKLTLREMLFFTAYHNAHHARRVLERASNAAT